MPLSPLLVGAGTVLTREQALSALGSGARFLVSPSYSEAVAEVARQAGAAYVPGVASATEAIRAL